MMNRIKKFGSVKITTKDRLFNAGYGIGASIVILGVLFKLMYWEGANLMLTVGLITEALIFAMSAFERPLKSYEWDKIFDFESGKLDLQIDGSSKSGIQVASGSEITPAPQTTVVNPPPAQNYPATNAFPGVTNVEGLSDDDAEKLSKKIGRASCRERV